MHGKKAWDIVPDLSDQRARSMKQLTALATSVVQTFLGPSPQALEEADHEDRYMINMQHWNEMQEQARSMSDVEFIRARENGLLDPPKRTKVAQQNLDTWLRERIRERMLSKVDGVLLDILGIERDGFHGNLRLKSSTSRSVLSNQLSERAQKIAAEMVGKWLDENENSLATGMKMEDVSRQFSSELGVAVKRSIEERIRTIASERARSIREDVLEAAVDQAMFDSYPILRTMDAASRLGAKTEKETT